MFFSQFILENDVREAQVCVALAFLDKAKLFKYFVTKFLSRKNYAISSGRFVHGHCQNANFATT
jgi:hypothetical protein